jgi:O-antigen ligase
MPLAHLFGYAGSILALPSLLDKKCRQETRYFTLPFLILIAYFIVRSLFLDSPGSGLIEIPDILTSYVMPFVAGYAIAAKREFFVRIYAGVWAAILSASLLSAVGILPETLVGRQRLWSEGMIWGLHHHNDTAACLVFFLPVLLSLAVSRGRKVWWILSLLFLVGLVLSGSRGYYLAFVPAVLGFTLRELARSGRGKYLIITAAFVFGLLILLVPGTRTRIDWMLAGDASISSRLNLLRVGGKIIREHPLTGIGPAQLERHPEYLEQSLTLGYFIDERTGRLKHLHNVYTTVAVEWGLIGLALFVWGLAAVGKRLASGDAMARALFWGYVGLLVGNLFDVQLMGPSAGMDFFFMAGLFTAAAAAPSPATQKSPSQIS